MILQKQFLCFHERMDARNMLSCASHKNKYNIHVLCVPNIVSRQIGNIKIFYMLSTTICMIYGRDLG